MSSDITGWNSWLGLTVKPVKVACTTPPRLLLVRSRTSNWPTSESCPLEKQSFFFTCKYLKSPPSFSTSTHSQSGLLCEGSSGVMLSYRSVPFLSHNVILTRQCLAYQTAKQEIDLQYSYFSEWTTFSRAAQTAGIWLPIMSYHVSVSNTPVHHWMKQSWDMYVCISNSCVGLCLTLPQHALTYTLSTVISVLFSALRALLRFLVWTLRNGPWSLFLQIHLKEFILTCRQYQPWPQLLMYSSV